MMSDRLMRILIVLFLLAVVRQVAAQPAEVQPPKGSALRTFLGLFTISGSVGYGATFSSHKFNGPALITNPGSATLMFDGSAPVGDTIALAYANWMAFPQPVNGVPVDTNSFLLRTDTAAIKYRSVGQQLPVNLSVHITIDRYRIGGGFSFEPYFTGRYKPDNFKEELGTFRPAYNLSHYTRWHGLLGVEVFRSKRYTLVVEATVGTYKLKKKDYNPDIIKRSIFFNLGARFEKSLSEYVRLFARPAFEYKNYTITSPESGVALTQQLPAFYFTLGLSWRLPDLRRCPIGNCHTQKDHHHGGKVYRSRMHPFWKWQDPDYGENYPRLIRYKGKNKRKLNPY